MEREGPEHLANRRSLDLWALQLTNAKRHRDIAIIRVKGDPLSAQTVCLLLIEGMDSVETTRFLLTLIDLLFGHVTIDHYDTMHVTSRTRPSHFLHVTLKTWSHVIMWWFISYGHTVKWTCRLPRKQALTTQWMLILLKVNTVHTASAYCYDIGITIFVTNVRFHSHACRRKL